MEFPDLHLPEITFREAPTHSQLVNTITDIEKFLSQVSAAILLSGLHRLGDQPVAAFLGAVVQLRAAADQLEKGPSNSGLAIPQPAPVPMPRR